MTNLPRNRLHALGPLPGNVNPNMLPVIGAPPPQPEPMTLLKLTQLLCNDLCQWSSFADEHARLTAHVNAQPGGPTPEAQYTLALMHALAVAQDSVRAVVAEERARVAIPPVSVPFVTDAPPETNGHAEGGA